MKNGLRLKLAITAVLLFTLGLVTWLIYSHTLGGTLGILGLIAVTWFMILD